MSEPIIIDQINIRLPRGWQGNPSQLARAVAEQLQRQAADLTSAQQLALDLRGPFSGVDQRVAQALERQLTARFGPSGNGSDAA